MVPSWPLHEATYALKNHEKQFSIVFEKIFFESYPPKIGKIHGKH